MAQEEFILKGTYSGYVKCTYGIVNDEQGQPIFTFAHNRIFSEPILIAKDIRMVQQIPAILTPAARQYFLTLCESYGWYLASDGTLQEIPNSDVYREKKETLYIDTDGNLKVKVVEPGGWYTADGKKTIKKMYGALHTKFYQKAVKLLPYISGEKAVYVRPTNFRWKEKYLEIEAKENSTNNNKVLGLLLAAAMFLLSK